MGCAADLSNISGFSAREVFTVTDATGKTRWMGLNHKEGCSRAQAWAKREGADMVILTGPAFVATQQQATSQDLIRTA